VDTTSNKGENQLEGGILGEVVRDGGQRVKDRRIPDDLMQLDGLLVHLTVRTCSIPSFPYQSCGPLMNHTYKKRDGLEVRPSLSPVRVRCTVSRVRQRGALSLE
jgi:hypothetical protein